MTFEELADRVERLEQRSIQVEDLPLGQLQRKLERTWQPDGGVLLQAKSVSADALGRGTIITGEERLRIVRGGVSPAGALTDGAGFTSVRTAVGTYTVTFGDGFAVAPVVAPGAWAGGINITARAAGAFSVFAFNTATGAALDAAWDFLAIGLD